MIEMSDHARKEMEDDDISEEEVYQCLKLGSVEIKQFIDGELRYGKKYEFRNKVVMIIYTYKEDITRVITCYTIRRKKWQKE